VREASPSAAASSFRRGLGVLAHVLDHDGVRADELAAALQLPLSSAYRYLRTLREQEFVAERDGAYVAGPRLRGQGVALPHRRLAEAAAPYLDHLTEATRETAVLVVRRGLHAVCIRQAESPHDIRLAFRVGQLLPLHAGATQRVLLAFAPEDVLREALSSEVRAFTPGTPGRDELARSLRRVRAERFAMSRGELTRGSVALGVPVLRGDDAVCAIGVAGPANRCTAAWQASARRELEECGRSLSDAVEA
jgi:DNA-binding IclR family transcriptional regulator